MSEPDRHDLYEGLEQLMGRKRAETMMQLLPPTGWGEVATRRDLEAHQIATRQALEAHQAETRQALEANQAETRQALEAHRAETSHQLEALRTEMTSRFEILESRVNERIMRTALTVNIPTVIASVGLTFAATRFG